MIGEGVGQERALVELLASKPDYLSILNRAVELERENANDNQWLGFEYMDVPAHSARLNELVVRGILRHGHRSRKYTHYRLAVPASEVERILAVQQVGVESPSAWEGVRESIPADLFSVISGHESVKEDFRLAIAADRPVHLLLEGPPATAKSLFLGELARLPAARLASMTNASRAGLIAYLLAEDVRFLVLDEIEKADARDRAALLTVMESGLISELKFGRSQSTWRPVWVFAACNSTAKLERELLSRFLVEQLHPLAPPEFLAAMFAILTQREQVEVELAHEIASRATGRTQDPRDVVRIARMARGDRELALRLIDRLL